MGNSTQSLTPQFKDPLPKTSNLHWLKTLSIGFSIVSFCIAIGIGGYMLTAKKPIQQQKNETPTIPDSSTTPPLLIKHLGVIIDTYDPKTNTAGDFVFTKQKLQFDRLISDYGFVIPANSMGAQKSNPQPTFILPLGTNVHSLVDGVVVSVPKLYSNDYTIIVAYDKNSRIRYETEHVINPMVKEGDRVVAGQIIAQVSDYDKNNPGYGLVEIGILIGGNPPRHVCPFLYLDPSIKESVYSKLRGFHKAWNKYRGKTVYDESSYPTPGCLTLQKIEG